MGQYNFNKDINVGEDGEKVVINDLQSIGLTLISDNKDNKYDIHMSKNGKDIYYEVKTDEWCIPNKEIILPSGVKIEVKGRDNGNLFIEFECRGKESGINVTKADYFVNYLKNYNEIWYIKTDKLLDLIKINEDIVISEQAGDLGSNTKGYLIPREKYKSHFIIRKT